MGNLLALADQCVQCGLCLPHCPTYRVWRLEPDSPRGRIALMRAGLEGTLPTDASLLTHVDRCLGCSGCERVCPSGVDYRRLLDGFRQRTYRPAADRVARRWRHLARSVMPWRIAGWIADVARLVMPRRLRTTIARRAGGVVAAGLALPPSARAPVAFTPAQGRRRGTLILFRGCVAAILDADTHAAAAEVFSRLGYDVHAPAGLCCGALAAHAGADDEARRDVAVLRETLDGLPPGPLVGTATGCQRQLRTALAGQPRHVADALALLAADSVLAERPWRPYPRRVTVMLPCTQGDAGDAVPWLALLRRIPSLELSVLPEQPRCCGAAGTAFMAHPALATALRDERIAQLRASAPDLVLTTNIGCRIHLLAGLAAEGLDVPVAHPISLIQECLP